MSKIAVFGTGYVGLVTGVCFADMGHNVICVDIDAAKVDQLRQGKSPIYEPGLEELLKQNIEANRLQFSTSSQEGIAQSDIIFVAVGTPPHEDGSADVDAVLKITGEIAHYLESHKIIVIKSTVPVGTCARIKNQIAEILTKRHCNADFDVCSNPEFFREGSALEDSLKPSRVIIGTDSTKAAEVMRDLYEPFLNGNPFLLMDFHSSEMTKYAANAMLAARISLMNEFSRICEHTGADIEAVRKGLGTDPRIGPQFLLSGLGYGGSCFPKDIRALIRTGENLSEDLQILKAVEKTNSHQQSHFFNKIHKHFQSDLNGKVIAVWGAAFKPGTDDIREAPALRLVEKILMAGGHVRLYDPIALDAAKKHFAHTKNLHFFEDQYDVLQDAEALVIATEWKIFREPVFEKMKDLLKKPVIFDGRNIFPPKKIKDKGFTYYSVGRPS